MTIYPDAYADYYAEALAYITISWPDIGGEELPEAVRQQAQLLAGGFDGYGIPTPADISPYRPLRFA